MLGSLLRKDASLALSTDLYEVTMALAFWQSGMAEREAVFHMFYRNNPFGGGFVLMAGLETLIEMVRDFRFSAGDLEYLATLKDGKEGPLFEPAFLEHLSTVRFACDLFAVPEGTVVFPHEPLVRVRGPILQANPV